MQKYLATVPERLALSSEDGLLLCHNHSFYYNLSGVSLELLRELQNRYGNVCLLTPQFPDVASGITKWTVEGLAGAHRAAIELVISKLNWLDSHCERGLTLKEVYETSENGQFEIWAGKNACRLILCPNDGEIYGYAVIVNGPSDFFMRRSRTCKKEGHLTAAGNYKRCSHRIERTTRTNIDLIADSGSVSMLSLLVAGAGFKAFPRQSPEQDTEHLFQ